VSLTQELEGWHTINQILETIELWNEKLTAKERPRISNPIIIGLTLDTQPFENINSLITDVMVKPVVADRIKEVLVEIRGF